MTITDIEPPTRSPHRPPYQPPYQRRVAGTSISERDGRWDAHLDTLPMLRTSDIRSMERLRAIIAYARQGIADLDALLATLNPPSPAAAGQDVAR
ncbi:unnamed protein product [[Actinomadura] parvosata subsp. kistnae]|uniref:Uncharacterized protein n=1 Tax=[Actinomadura] parvosata subsp. kistnae TaxID=1909395 RepID=A0A1U9ZYN9_9ACTN|nr:hypothetical protein [Nonomuraea sp. ATCC 55076]AQZ63047.1 hypothetical protein BKM31_17675 [Nonomuraea sp. ATCC 55076]SPL98667.1 unnamed protein product [Actinomadura parvosata subsp. kistnae]